jgi:RecA/RadA recombinase
MATLSDRRRKINEVLSKIDKSLGEAVIVCDSVDMRTPFHIRRPTGIISMDIELVGGFPGGTLVQLHGEKGTGKTGLACAAAGMNQRLYSDEAATFFSSFGYRMDASLARLVGVQVAYSDDELTGLGIDAEDVPDEYAGDTVGVFKIITLQNSDTAKDAPAEAIFETATELIESGAFQIGIIDEMGSGETRDDVKKQFKDERRMAAWSRLVTQFCVRMYTKFRIPQENGEPVDTVLFVINPARANINTSGGRQYKKTTETSGFALQHAKAVDIHLRKGKPFRKGDKVVAFEVNWTIAKGKHGLATGAKGQYIWNVDSGPDVCLDLAQTAKIHGIAVHRGRWYTIDMAATEEEIADESITVSEDGFRRIRIGGGLPGVVAALRADEELFFDVYHATLQAALGYNPLFASMEA